MSADNGPAVGTRWQHRQSKREVKVVAVRAIAGGALVVDYKYKRGVGGNNLGWQRTVSPMQTMPLEQWRGLFTIEVPEQPIAPTEVEDALKAGAKERAAAEKTLKRSPRR